MSKMFFVRVFVVFVVFPTSCGLPQGCQKWRVRGTDRVCYVFDLKCYEVSDKVLCDTVAIPQYFLRSFVIHLVSDANLLRGVHPPRTLPTNLVLVVGDESEDYDIDYNYNHYNYDDYNYNHYDFNDNYNSCYNYDNNSEVQS